MQNLYPYQEEAVDKIVRFFHSDTKDGKIYLATGVGKVTIITTAIKELLQENSNIRILVLCFHENSLELYRKKIIEFTEDPWGRGQSEGSKRHVELYSYRHVSKLVENIDYHLFDFIICDEMEFLYPDGIYSFLEYSTKIKHLGIVGEKNLKGYFLDRTQFIYQYSLSDAIHQGHIYLQTEWAFIQDFFVSLLDHLGYSNILLEQSLEKKNMRVDLIADKGGNSFAFEVKTYRTPYISSSLIKQVICQMESIQMKLPSNYRCVVVMGCLVERSLKEAIYKEKQIEIWDVSNILYMSYGFYDLVSKLAKVIPYSISDIEKEMPLCYEKGSTLGETDVTTNYYHLFQQQLFNCPPGKELGADKKYEKICTDIITYLFETEFFQMISQHKTKDEMFQMDLICSLKGTTAFWKFLMQFYNTKFVVFEYKNYADLILQNSIYITEKYLFPAALRNVSFLISRKGFHKNAYVASVGCLKEDGKLIIELTDEDLLVMVALKEKGEEPSDYLLNKVEQFLMSVSK